MKTQPRTRRLALVFAMLMILSIAPVVLAQSGGEGESGDDPPGENFFCQSTDAQHPVGFRIADNYQIPYEEVMSWFCGGFGFGQIKQALQISAVTGRSPTELLQMKTDGNGWGEIRQALGLVGPPDRDDGNDDVDPPGKGNRKPFKHHGRPPWAGRPGGPWGENPPPLGDD